jgi:hypothetical protein
MIQNDHNLNKDLKQRLTAFVDPGLVQRAKVRGALEGLTISEVVEKALDAYVPKIEKRSNQHINIKFTNYPAIASLIPEVNSKTAIMVPKHTEDLVVPRQ